MSGSIDLNPPPVSLSGNAAQLSVYRVSGASYSLLANIRCLSITETEGPAPPIARFEYVFDDNLAATFGWPSRIEQVFPLDAQGQYTVQVDDEIAVMATNPDGSPCILFHGFAQIPQIDLGANSEACNFVAVGAAARAYDRPIHGRFQRNADQQAVTTGSQDVTVELPARFNPADETAGSMGGYLGNCVAPANFTQGPLGDYPVFLDEKLLKPIPFVTTSYWFISDAIKYLLAWEDQTTSEADSFIVWPTFDSLDALLNAQYPTGTGPYSPGGPGTASADITLRDYDAQGKALPVVVAELLGYAGFLMCWTVDLDAGDNSPLDRMRIYRRDGAATNPAKAIYLAPEGTSIDPSTSNAATIHIARDTHDLINAYYIETAPRQVEITVLLAPLFQPAAGDQDSPASDAFLLSNLTGATADVRDKYRTFGADECGCDGHWNSLTLTWVVGTPLDLSKVFPPRKDSTPTYVRRYRKPSHALVARDTLGKPLKATLEISFGAASVDPALDPGGDDPGTWLTAPSGWSLLPDRLGIELTDKDIRMWTTGTSKGAKVDVIAALAVPTAKTDFALRLTTVIEADGGLDIKALKRVASPTRFQRTRVSDGHDTFKQCSIAVNSLNYTGNGTDPQVIRDDTDAAQTHAYILRSSTEFPLMAGSIHIPYLTTYYEVGDLIVGIAGRGVSLQTNVGAGQGEAPCYGWVHERSWTNDGNRQGTTLQISDERARIHGHQQ